MARPTVRPLEPSDWPALAKLFGERGACGGCWCMCWRRPLGEWERHKGQGNRDAFRRLVRSGRATGVLAFDGEEAVGWCSVAPRADFEALERKRSLATDWDERTWSVTCFFVDREWRGRGLGTKLLAGAVDVARAGGARRLEGYPAKPGKDGLPPAFAWTGVPRLFERARFRPLPDPPGKRPIYVRNLRAGRSRIVHGR